MGDEVPVQSLRRSGGVRRRPIPRRREIGEDPYRCWEVTEWSSAASPPPMRRHCSRMFPTDRCSHTSLPRRQRWTALSGSSGGPSGNGAAARTSVTGVVPRETGRVIGVIQTWPVERDYSVAERGFVLGRAYWGTGLFVDAACLFLTFTFDWLGVERLEARAGAMNGRGNGALRKLGAVREGVLRSAFQAELARLDHVMWSILSEDWASNKTGLCPGPRLGRSRGPCARLRSLAGALRAPGSHRAAAEGASDEQACGL
jgi:RimJ/RimL family protein N-acetyltransferase